MKGDLEYLKKDSLQRIIDDNEVNLRSKKATLQETRVATQLQIDDIVTLETIINVLKENLN